MRFDPWRELDRMNWDLGRLFGDASGLDRPASWSPRVDVRENKDSLVVQAELPGISKEDVQVEVNDGVLTISGKTASRKDVTEESVHRIERQYGEFMRSFNLPSNVDSGKVSASMKDGILELTIPKKETSKPRAIEVK